MLTPMLTSSTWIARRWPGLQRANQVRVLVGFSFESGFEAPGLVASVDDLAVMGEPVKQRGGHLGVAEDG